jgi:hypothetical protein
MLFLKKIIRSWKAYQEKKVRDSIRESERSWLGCYIYDAFIPVKIVWSENGYIVKALTYRPKTDTFEDGVWVGDVRRGHNDVEKVSEREFNARVAQERETWLKSIEIK